MKTIHLKNMSLAIGVAMSLALMASGCGETPISGIPAGSGGGATTTPPSTAEVATISVTHEVIGFMIDNCGKCHSQAANGGFQFAASSFTADTAAQAVGASMPYLTTGPTTNSYIWHKLNNTQLSVGGSGVRMPLGRAAVSDSVLELFSDYIAAITAEDLCRNGNCESDNKDDGTDDDVTDTTDPTLTDLKTSVFSSCTGCHTGSGGSLPGSMDLGADAVYSSVVGIASEELPSMNRIEPNDAANSYLLHKVSGTHLDAGGSGVAMPQGTSGLSQTKIDQLTAWIENGAPND